MQTQTNVYNPYDERLEDLAFKQFKEMFGASGTEVFSGYYSVDEVIDWNNAYQRAVIVDKIRFQNQAAQAGLTLLKAPILAAEWYVDGGEDEHREFIKEQLFEMQLRTWEEFLEEVLTYLPHGYSAWELILRDTANGKRGLYDVAPRIQKSIEKFQQSDGSPGIQQNLYGDITPDGSTNSVVDIPLQKLIIFTNEKEGDNLMGRSVLRAARKHFDHLDRFYAVTGMSFERFGMGIPVVTHPALGGNQKSKAEELGKNIKANHQGYITITEGWDVELLTPGSNPLGPMAEFMIAHHTRQIFLSTLSHGLDLGSTSAGSFALSSNQTADRLSYASQKAKYISTQVNKKIIRPLVNLNWGPQEKYPELKFETLGLTKSPELANMYESLYRMGVIDSDPELANHLRKLFDLPVMSEEELAMRIEENEQRKQMQLENYVNIASPKGVAVSNKEEVDEEDEEEVADAMKDKNETNDK